MKASRIYLRHIRVLSADAEPAAVRGWGVAWRINLNARALNGDFASTLLNQLFTTRTSPNLFDQHPNFQIDGNYGAASGITEMVMQSHDGSINLIPAIPSDWQAGSFKGLKALGGATVDLTWVKANLLKQRLLQQQTES